MDLIKYLKKNVKHKISHFNFKKIKTSLKNKGYFFKTNSDTEVILNAFNYFGYECLKYFNGMFSIAIWDSLKKELFLLILGF